MKHTFVILIAVLVVLVSQLHAESEDGGYAGAFLQLGLSARAVGMGQAYFAVSDDATALFYNPAGAAQIDRRTIGFAFRSMDLDRSLGYASINFPVRSEATVSLGWIFAGTSGILERDSEGYTGDELACSENAISVCFARRFSNIVSIGGTAKYHISKLANVTTSTAGFDIGTYFRLARGEVLGEDSPIDMIRIGIVVGSVAATSIWTTGDYWIQRGAQGDSRTDPYPLLIGCGMSVLTLDEALLVAFDARKYEWQSVSLHGGAEYRLHEMFVLRAGLNDLHPTFGFGVEKAFTSSDKGGDEPFTNDAQEENKGVRLSIDYVFSSPKTEIRADHLFSIGFAF